MVYMGSKARLAKYIIPIINHLIKVNNCDTFIDGFVGGGNIIANPKYNIECKNKYGFDNNKYLIALLNKMKNNEIQKCIYVTKDEYEKVRDNKNFYEDWYVGYVGFIIGYSGKWFSGYTQNFCDKQGKRNYVLERFNNLKQQKEKLQDCNLFVKDFFDLNTEKINNNILIYIDPPYQNVTKYGNGNNILDYELFWNTIRELSKKCIVIVSEYSAPNDFECIYEHPPMKMSLDNKRKLNGKENIEKLWVIKNHWWKD